MSRSINHFPLPLLMAEKQGVDLPKNWRQMDWRELDELFVDLGIRWYYLGGETSRRWARRQQQGRFRARTRDMLQTGQYDRVPVARESYAYLIW